MHPWERFVGFTVLDPSIFMDLALFLCTSMGISDDGDDGGWEMGGDTAVRLYCYQQQ